MLTAETVIGALEDAEDYKAFEAAITADWMLNPRHARGSLISPELFPSPVSSAQAVLERDEFRFVDILSLPSSLRTRGV